MKRILYTISFFIIFQNAAYAQEEEERNGEKMRQRMSEYIQKELNLSKAEADKFSPGFISYFNELRKTNQLYRGDRLMLQQKTADLRLRYRNQFKPILGDKRSNNVFVYERKFVEEVKRLRKERNQIRKNTVPNKKARGQLQQN
jgi:hypothetical protein